MARKRRPFNVFSMSFLDVMSCGFGAVILIFLIINHESQEDADVINKDLLSEVRLLDYQVAQGEEDLFELKEALDATLRGLDESEKKLEATEVDVAQKRKDFGELSETSLAEQQSINALESDVEERTEELKKLLAIKKVFGDTATRTCHLMKR